MGARDRFPYIGRLPDAGSAAGYAARGFRYAPVGAPRSAVGGESALQEAGEDGDCHGR